MADNTKPQDDLSIEEILGSIRRIIAEDVTEGEDGAQNAEGDEAVEDEEPLELVNKISDDGNISPPDTISLENPFADDSFQEDVQETTFQDEAENEPSFNDTFVEEVPETHEKIALQETRPMSTENSVPENLLSPSASIATAAVMAKLARQAAVNEDGNNSLTIEAMVREMLKPMLKEWLDANLPELVQKMVERELERLTKRL